MKRKISSLLWGTLLCLPMLLASCNEKDNALEQIVNQPNLEGIQKALYKNAEIKIEYKAWDTDFTAILKNSGTIENPNYEVTGDFPTDLSYALDYEDGLLYFSLLTPRAIDNTGDEPAGTRADDDPEPNIGDDIPVMVVMFDTNTNKYEVYALPLFSFNKVLIINGAEMEIEDASKDNKATIKLYYEASGPTTIDTGFEFEVGLNGISTWADVDKAFDDAGIGVFAPLHNDDPSTDGIDDSGTMVIDLSDYAHVYSMGSIPNWDHFIMKDNDNNLINSTHAVTKATYKAIDELARVLIPCYEMATIGRSVLVDMLALAIPPGGTPTWKDIAETNSSLIKVVTDRSKASPRERIVCKPGVVNSIDPNSYFGLFKGLSRTRENADNLYEENGSYKFYDLSDWVKSADIDWTPTTTGVLTSR